MSRSIAVSRSFVALALAVAACVNAGPASAAAVATVNARPRKIEIALTQVGTSGYKGGNASRIGSRVWFIDPASSEVLILDPKTLSITSMAADGNGAVAETQGLTYLSDQGDDGLSPRLRSFTTDTLQPRVAIAASSVVRGIAAARTAVWTLSAAKPNDFSASVLERHDLATLAVTKRVPVQGFFLALVNDATRLYTVGGVSALEVRSYDLASGKLVHSATLRGPSFDFFSGLPLTMAHGRVIVGTCTKNNISCQLEVYRARDLKLRAVYPLRAGEIPTDVSVSGDELAWVSYHIGSIGSSDAQFGQVVLDLRSDPAHAVAEQSSTSGQAGHIAFTGRVGWFAEAGPNYIWQLKWGPVGSFPHPSGPGE